MGCLKIVDRFRAGAAEQLVERVVNTHVEQLLVNRAPGDGA